MRARVGATGLSPLVLKAHSIRAYEKIRIAHTFNKSFDKDDRFRKNATAMHFKVPYRGSVNPTPLGGMGYDLAEMQDYKRGSLTIWDCKYHLVWVTRYRYPILVGDVGQRARELLREIARSNEMTIYAGAINRDHVHMLISIPPQLSVSRAICMPLTRMHSSIDGGLADRVQRENPGRAAAEDFEPNLSRAGGHLGQAEAFDKNTNAARYGRRRHRRRLQP